MAGDCWVHPCTQAFRAARSRASHSAVGVTLTPSSGTALADVVTDLKAALAPILLAGGGRRLVWVMNPLQAMSLSLQTDGAGTLVWPDDACRLGIADVIMSPDVPAGALLMVDADDLITVANDVPQLEVSRDATLHLDDARRTISDGTFSSPVISMFQ